MNLKNLIICISALLAILVTASVRADAITLRPGATVSGDGPITLADVALLTGEDALDLAGLTLIPDAKKAANGKIWVEVSLKDVRSAMRTAGVKPGPIALSGSRCTVRILSNTPPIDEAAIEPAPEARRAEVVTLEGPATVRTRVAQAIARLYAVPLDDLRLLFDERDDEFLSQPEHGRRVVVVTGTSSSSSRQSAQVRIFAGDTITDTRSVTVNIEIRCNAVVVAKDIPRRTNIEPHQLRTQRMWVEAGGAAIFTDPSEAIGDLAKTDLKAGTVLRANQTQAAVLVRRGTLVNVYCLSGGIALEMQGRALATGKKGDVIEVRRDGSDRSFLARVDGENSVVIDLDGTPVAGQ